MDYNLQITTLGEVAIKLDGKDLKGALTRKAEALFIYLACTGQVFPRETLAELFWNSEDLVSSLNSLRVALTQLRPFFNQYLKINRNEVYLNRQENFDLDINTLQKHLQQAAQLAANPPAAMAELEKAVSLYKGPFFQGWYLKNSAGFEHWQLAQQQYFQQLVFVALQELVNYNVRNGNYSLALKYIQAWLEIDPFNEDAHRQYMLALASSGQRHAALEYYARCEKLLLDELSITPSPATLELYWQIKDGGFPMVPLESPSLSLATPMPVALISVAEAPPKIPLSHNFPYPMTSLVAREAEVQRVRQLLDRPNLRLVTLTGAGGSGKTRLATEVALELSNGSEFKDGITFVPLSAYRNPNELVFGLAQALELKPNPQVSLLESLKDHLRGQQHLLVIDNFEHLIEAAGVVSEILKVSPGLKALVTSRERLNIYGEQLFPVQPLAVPGDTDPDHLESLGANASVRLFVERIKAYRPDFELNAQNVSPVARICVRLEGLPLAIELAVARTNTLSFDTLLAQLDRRLQVLSGGPQDLETRQQTLRAALDWSYYLLSPALQKLLRFMSVIAGSCSREAAVQIFDFSHELEPGDPATAAPENLELLERLHSLVEKSLLQRLPGPDGETRFGLLQTISEYAYERLREAQEDFELYNRFALYFTHLAEWSGPNLNGPDTKAVSQRMDAEYTNILAALYWSDQHNFPLAVRIVTALEPYWELKAYHQQARVYLEQLLERLPAEEGVLRAKVLTVASTIAWRQSDYPAAQRFCQEALEYYQARDNREGIAQIKFKLATILVQKGEIAQGERLLDESLAIFQEFSHVEGIAQCLSGLAAIYSERGLYDQALDYHGQSLALYRQLGNKRGIVVLLTNLGTVAARQQDFAAARRYYEESLLVLEELNNPLQRSITLNNLGLLAVSQHDYDTARTYYDQALALYEEVGQVYGQANVLIDQALVAYYQRNPVLALSHLARSFDIARKLDNTYLQVYGLAGVSEVMGQLGCDRQAVLLGEGALNIAAQNGFLIEDLYHKPLQEGLDLAHANLGAALYDEIKAEACRMELNPLVDLALEDCQAQVR